MTSPVPVPPRTPPAPGPGQPSLIYLPTIDLTSAPVPVTVSASYLANALMYTGCGLIIAVTWVNRAPTAALNADILDGVDATGLPVVQMGAAAGGGGVVTPCLPGIPFRNGLYRNVTAGQPNVTVTFIPLPQAP